MGAGAAKMCRRVRFLECTDKMCHVPFCMYGPSRPVQQRCGACCNFWSVQTRCATCHSACMVGAGLCSRNAAHGATFGVYRPGVPHAILHAWAGHACAAEMRGMLQLLECTD